LRSSMNKRLVVAMFSVLPLAGVGALNLAQDDEGVLKLGDVLFPHDLHYDELELECEICHHETQATVLDIPHTEYFKDFWIKCAICHREDATASGPLACSECHHSSPADVADETLSAKVVIHQSCWECHEIGTGAEASRGCSSCHTGDSR